MNIPCCFVSPSFFHTFSHRVLFVAFLFPGFVIVIAFFFSSIILFLHSIFFLSLSSSFHVCTAPHPIYLYLPFLQIQIVLKKVTVLIKRRDIKIMDTNKVIHTIGNEDILI